MVNSNGPGARRGHAASGPCLDQPEFRVHDPGPLAQASAVEFADRYNRNGGSVENRSDLGAYDPTSNPAFEPVVQTARSLAADVLYFAGSDLEGAGRLRAAMAGPMPGVPLLATDRLANSQFAKSAGASVRGTYYLVVGAYAPRLSGAATFRAAYRKAYGSEASNLGVQAYDAATVLIQAIRRAIDDAGGAVPTRQQVLRQVALTHDLDGLMGTFGFDARGDTTLKLVSVYQWVAPLERSGEFVTQFPVR